MALPPDKRHGIRLKFVYLLNVLKFRGAANAADHLRPHRGRIRSVLAFGVDYHAGPIKSGEERWTVEQEVALRGQKRKTGVVGKYVNLVAGIGKGSLGGWDDLGHLLLVRPLEIARRLDLAEHPHRSDGTDDFKVFLSYLLFAVDQVPHCIGIEDGASCDTRVVCIGEESWAVGDAASKAPQILRVNADENGVDKDEGDFFETESGVAALKPACGPVLWEGDKRLKPINGEDGVRLHLRFLRRTPETELERGDAKLVEVVVGKSRVVFLPTRPERVGRAEKYKAAVGIIDIDERCESVIGRQRLGEGLVI